MAVAKKCDRCGNFYEAYCELSKDKSNGIAFIGMSNDSKKYRFCKIFDLCPECMNEVEDFLKENEHGADQN